MSAALSRADDAGFQPSTIDDGLRLAKILVASRMLPEAVSSPEAAFLIIMTGRELGISAMMALRSIHVVKGKTLLSADLVCALVKRRRDVCEYFSLVSSTNEAATYVTRRVGESSETSMMFTIEDAKRAQLLRNSTWQSYPAAMLRARCITALARAVYPDLAMGIYDPDEIGAEVSSSPVTPPSSDVVVRELPRIATPSLEGALQDSIDTVQAGLFGELAKRITASDKSFELNLVSKDIKAAIDSSKLAASAVDELRSLMRNKKAELAATAPKVAPKLYIPAADVTADGYAANEAEGEVMAAQYDE